MAKAWNSKALLCSATSLSAFLFLTSGGAAYAQSDPAAEEASEVDTSSIIVTGSRIRRPNLDSGAPITTVAGEEFFETGRVSVGDVLNEMPQLRATFSQQNSTRFLGTRGLNLLDLRGLNTQRTLVVVNGRRHVAGDVLSNAVSPDINTFPTDLIESVDILTGGGASVYGSDAIAGVVNFRLKQDYEGLQLRGQAGVSKYKDAGNQYLSLLAGTNFSEGRGNIAVNLEYSHQSDYYTSGRKELRQANGLVIVDSDPAGSDETPDRLFLKDIRSTTISLGGMLNLANPTGACGRAANGAVFNCTYIFQPDGTLVPQTGTRVGLAPNGSFLGGNGYSGREGQLLALSPELNRYSANILGHYEFSPAFVGFFEAKYVRTEARGSQSGPFFSQGTTLGDPAADNREQIRLDNPYLSAQARSLIEAARAANGQTSTDATRFSLRRNWLDLGARDEEITRETYRIVGGVRGDFNDDWNYELSLNYGQHREKNKILSNVNVQRYLLAIDSVRNAAGQIVCRSQLNPAGTPGYLTDENGDPRTIANDPFLAADIASCAPLNPFGEGSSSQAGRNYVQVDSGATGKITQFVASGFVSGDLSQLFELPGGPIGFSVGGEYRKETLRYDLDDLTQAGYAFYNAIPSFTAPSFEVKEAFGEISVPLLKDIPFIKELTVTGSGRIADYKGATGTVYTYGGDVAWRPVDDLLIRGSYTRAIRAPNLTELYSAQGQNFAPAPLDPCALRNIGQGSSTRAANCAAAGIPTGYDFVYTQSLETISGGNPLLREEKSDNYTIGGVFTPTFAPGLSLSVDYYNITVKNVIQSIDAQSILNKCYDSPTLENTFCDLFQRNGGGGAGPRGEVPFQVLDGTLIESSANFAKLKVRGIDTEFAYRQTFSWGSASLRASWTHVLQNDAFIDPGDPTFADQALYEVGDPKDRVTVSANAKVGKVTLGYQFRWIGKQVFGEAENTISVQGRDPVNADYAELPGYPNVFYHDVRFDYEVNDDYNLYLGVDNLLNRFPPIGGTGIGAGLDNVGVTGLYDNRGRYFYAGFVAKL